MLKAEVQQIARTVWKSGEIYIGPNLESLQEFAEKVAEAAIASEKVRLEAELKDAKRYKWLRDVAATLPDKTETSWWLELSDAISSKYFDLMVDSSLVSKRLFKP